MANFNTLSPCSNPAILFLSSNASLFSIIPSWSYEKPFQRGLWLAVPRHTSRCHVTLRLFWREFPRSLVRRCTGRHVFPRSSSREIESHNYDFAQSESQRNYLVTCRHDAGAILVRNPNKVFQVTGKPPANKCKCIGSARRCIASRSGGGKERNLIGASICRQCSAVGRELQPHWVVMAVNSVELFACAGIPNPDAGAL